MGIENAKQVATPMNSNETISKNDCPRTNEDIHEMQNISYQEAVCDLMDLSQLSRYNSNPNTDADWAASVGDRKSTTGYVFVAKGGVGIRNLKQGTVPTLVMSIDLLCTRRHQVILFNHNETFNIYCDNQRAIAIVSSGVLSPNTKHIDTRHYFIQDTLAGGISQPHIISTEKEMDDGFKNSFHKTKFARVLQSPR